MLENQFAPFVVFFIIIIYCVFPQLYGRRAVWEDPAAWVIDTYPWSATHAPSDWPPLLQLRPEDVGFDGYSAPREGVRKELPQSDSDADPLVRKIFLFHCRFR